MRVVLSPLHVWMNCRATGHLTDDFPILASAFDTLLYSIPLGLFPSFTLSFFLHRQKYTALDQFVNVDGAGISIQSPNTRCNRFTGRCWNLNSTCIATHYSMSSHIPLKFLSCFIQTKIIWLSVAVEYFFVLLQYRSITLSDNHCFIWGFDENLSQNRSILWGVLFARSTVLLQSGRGELDRIIIAITVVEAADAAVLFFLPGDTRISFLAIQTRATTYNFPSSL